MGDDRILWGHQEIADYVGVSKGHIQNLSKELHELGVIHTAWRYRGNPKRMRLTVWSTCGRLQAWMILRGEEYEQRKRD
jgi:hypothetical protein